ncbi:hypothetical protein HYR54_01995 [Candidatus Acetothermia bacterium]|nr:hypothetical protein [Candidatus Acetothermia bacterium]
MREIPDLTNVKIESQPKILFAAFPTRIRNGESTIGAIAFADFEDDVNLIRITYRAEESSLAGGVLALTLQELPIPSPYGEGLKAIKFDLKVGCAESLTFEATVIANDKAGHESEPFSFKFTCEA